MMIIGKLNLNKSSEKLCLKFGYRIVPILIVPILIFRFTDFDILLLLLGYTIYQIK